MSENNFTYENLDEVKDTSEISVNNIEADAYSINKETNEASAEENEVSNEVKEVGLQTIAEEFLESHYLLRRNVLRGMVEYRKIEETDDDFHPLTQEALKSIFIHSKHELGEEEDITGDIKMVVESEIPPLYNPIVEYFKSLPEWDGKDRIVEFWKRIPGLTAEHIYYLSIWFRAVGAVWLGMNTEHSNETVPVLIGDQGCGKSTFCLRILPPCFRCFFLDHLNVTNKHDMEMALSDTLLDNLDEIDRYKGSQMAAVKQALSKVTVTARRIYGRNIEVRPRFASFIATTNNRHPLVDPTGSRRFLVINIPNGDIIDNDTDIDYLQLYAQLYHELKAGERFWFTREETLRIQELNAAFEQDLDLYQILSYCYSKPEEGDEEKKITTADIRQMLKKNYPALSASNSSVIKIGKAMKELDFPKYRNMNRVYYLVAA